MTNTGDMTDMTDKDIAVAHWCFDMYGGGEFVGSELARTFDVPLYTSTKDEERTPDDVDVREVFSGIPRRLHERDGFLRVLAHNYVWEDLPELREADVVVTSGVTTLPYVPRDGQVWVHYTHHTDRHATDRLHYVTGADRRLDAISVPKDRIVCKAKRMLYRSYAKKPDVLVANSEVTQRRVRQHWGRDAVVIHPPVETECYDPDAEPTGDYYFTWSRHWPAKRLDTIIRAFAGRDERLVVGGTGPETEHLKEIGGENVEFRGWLTADEKQRLASGANATLFAAEEEDFGLVPVESMASGTPVLGVAEGFTKHQIIDGVNGLLVPSRNLTAGFRTALDVFEEEGVAWSEQRIADWARDRFGRERFRAEVRGVVDEAVDRARVEAPWAEQAIDGVEIEPTEPEVATDGGDDSDR